MNIQQAKQIKLFDLLAHLGYHPTHIKNNGDDVWYLSPFRQEETPSFHISLRYNCWFDFAESNKGDQNSIVDFVIKYKRTDVLGSLNYLGSLRLSNNNTVAIGKPPTPAQDLFKSEQSKVEILDIRPLYAYPLKNYLVENRGISLELGIKYLREIKYKFLEGENNGKEFYSIGFRNRSGGWALRNKYFKMATKPNDISVIETGSNKISIYEGFMNFLSHLMLSRNVSPVTDVVILNSNSFKEIGKDFINKKGYDIVYSFLDNDQPGKKTLEYFKAELPIVTDCSGAYRGHNDLNEYLVNGNKAL
ncbi:MAG: toprim domain-containing protein [Segetibacter sp.]